MIVRMDDELHANLRRIVELAMAGMHRKHDEGIRWPTTGDWHDGYFEKCEHPDCCLYRDVLLKYHGVEELDPDWI